MRPEGKLLRAVILIAILWVGFALRMYQLGHDSFWNDEAGQALAAIQPTLRQMFAVEKTHVMAMPLDYLVSRAVSHIGLSETIMRFPSVFWGVLTLVICFNLVRRVARVQVALMTTSLLAISELHIHYSQEMRFYSALIFFYALSTYLLVRAMFKPRFLRWTVFVLVTAVGTYFHPFVLLSVSNGLFYLLMVRSAGRRGGQLLTLAVSSILIAIAFLPGYAYFGFGQQFDFDLWRWSPSLPETVAQAMGWMPLSYSPALASPRAWGVLTGGFFLVGLVSTIIRRDVRLLCLLLSLPLQTALVILADWAKGYWFMARQLVHLHPIALIFTGAGVMATSKFVSRLVLAGRLGDRLAARGMVTFSLAVLVITVGVLGLSSGPELREYYEWPKSVARDIVLEIVDSYCPGSAILVIPGYQEKVYRFYFQVLGKPGLAAALHSADWGDLEQAVACNSTEVYLIAPVVLTAAQHDELFRLGFVPLIESEVDWYRTQALFVAPGGD